MLPFRRAVRVAARRKEERFVQLPLPRKTRSSASSDISRRKKLLGWSSDPLDVGRGKTSRVLPAP